MSRQVPPNRRKSIPFGRPDGGRAETTDAQDDPLRDFVDFGPRFADRGLGMDKNDRSVRVIVGKKGAGKTLYLRRLQAFASDEPSLYADEIQQTHAKTDEVVRTSNLYQGSILVEKWMDIWKAAIFRSLLSHLLCARPLASHLAEESDADAVRALREDYGDLCPHFDVPHSVYSQARDLLNEYPTRTKLDRYLRHASWQSLEHRLAEVISTMPPICFYVDAIDEEFHHAPMFWLMCQKGLFYQVIRLLTDSRMGGRLHIVICVRDLVYSSTQTTEHGTRYLETQYIHPLEWDRDAIRYFLAEKLARLPGDYFVDGARASGRSVSAWLGASDIPNRRAERTVEDVENYLLRHTRLIPRDVVAMGNMLCKQIARSETRLTDSEIRSVVGGAARKFGDEQLAICANHIASDLMPADAAELGYSDIYTGQDAKRFEGGDAYHKDLVDDLREILSRLGADRFGKAKFDRLREDFDMLFEFRADAVTALWQNGLLGYSEGSVKGGRPVFYGVGGDDRMKIPQGKRGYVLHPILIDSIDGIRGVGNPVIPW